MRKLILAIGALLLGGLVGCGTKEETAMKIYVQQRNYDKAIQQGALALKQNPSNGDTHYFLGAAYYGKDNDLKPEAEGYADSSEKYLKLAFEHFTKAKELAPGPWGKSVDDNIVSMFGRHFNRGVIASKKSDNATAALEYRLATLADPENYQGYYAHAGVLMALAKDVQKAGDDAKYSEMVDAMLGDLNKVLDLKPPERDIVVNTYVAKGEVLYRKHDSKGAQDAFSEAVKLDPENYELLSTMGNRFYDEQDWEHAEKYFEDAVAIQERLNLIDTADFETYQLLASSRLKLGKREDAIEAFQKALPLAQSEDAKSATMFNIMVSHFKAAEAAEKDNKMDEAKDRALQAIAIGNELIRVDPNKPEYWQVIGLSKRIVGDTAGAARDLKRFNDLRSQQAGAH